MSHTVSLERRTNGSFSPIFTGEAVAPGEPVRLRTRNAIDGSKVYFSITDVYYPPRVFFGPIPAGEVFLGGGDFLDISAPDAPGMYYLRARMEFPFRNHDAPKLLFRVAPKERAEAEKLFPVAETIFKVSPEAQAPPRPPPVTGLGKFIPTIPDIKGLGLIAVGILGLLVLGKVVGGKR